MTITLKQIAERVHMSPKKVRNILRNDKHTPQSVEPKRWVFNTKDRRKVERIIRTHE